MILPWPVVFLNPTFLKLAGLRLGGNKIKGKKAELYFC